MSDLALQRRQRLTGIALMCGAVALFACLDTTAKYLNTQMDSLQIAWARYTSAFLLTLIVSNPLTQPSLLRSKRLKLQITRSVLLVGSTALNFLALRWLQLDEALSIIFTFPFIVAIVSGSDAGRMAWLAALVGDLLRLCRRSADHAAGLRRHAPGGAAVVGGDGLLRALCGDHAHRIAHRFQPDLVVLCQFHRRAGDAAGHPLRLDDAVELG